MRRTIQVAILTLVAIPAFSQSQIHLKTTNPTTASANTQVARTMPRLSLSTGLGDTVLAQVADGGGWQTTITLVNLRTTFTTWSLNCHGDDGSLQAFDWSGLGSSAGLYGNLLASGMLTFQTAGTASASSDAWCDVESPGNGANPSKEPNNDIAASAVFSYLPTGQEVAVPATPWASQSLILAYDNRNGYAYGVALADSNIYTYPGEPNDLISVSLKAADGTEVATDSFEIAPGGHTTFMLASKYSVTSDAHGTVTFTMVTPNLVPTLSGLGLRAAPTGSLTSVDMFEPMTN